MILAALIIALALMCSEVLRYELGRRLEDERHAHAWSEIREAHRLKEKVEWVRVSDGTSGAYEAREIL
jgi:hypothetical protein